MQELGQRLSRLISASEGPDVPAEQPFAISFQVQ